MTPGSFDPDTSREMVGDDRSRSIEAKARADADAKTYDPPRGTATTYWGRCQEDFAVAVYTAQYKKRIERNERKT